MGGSVSRRRSSPPKTPPSLNRDSRERRSLRSFRRVDKLSRSTSNHSLGRNSTLTMSQDNSSTVSNLGQSKSDLKETPKKRGESPFRSLRRGSKESRNLNRLSHDLISSPFTLMSKDDVFSDDDDFLAIKSYLQQHYSSKHGRAVLRSNSSDNPLVARNRQNKRPAYEAESITEVMRAKEELQELTLIEEKVSLLQERERRGHLNLNPCPVFFVLTPEDDSQVISLSTTWNLIQERKSYLLKKVDLESSHSQGIRLILSSNQNIHSSPQQDSAEKYLMSPSEKSSRPSITRSSSMVSPSSSSFKKPRKPRALSLIESADGIVGLDSSSYRNLVQDVKDVKTLLFRLQGLLQQDSNGGIKNNGDLTSVMEIVEENDRLRQQLGLLRVCHDSAIGSSNNSDPMYADPMPINGLPVTPGSN